MKKLLATTALALIMAGPAFADSAYKASESKTGAAPAASTQSGQTTVINKKEFEASNLIGMRVYSTDQEFNENAAVKPNANEEWQDIGEINDIVLTADGSVEAVIVGVGGVLGIGEKDVELTMKDITVLPQEGDSDAFFLVVKADLKELEAMPTYEPSDEARDSMQKSESEAKDGLTPEERQAEAPAAPSDKGQQQAATPPPPPEQPAGEQQMAQGEQPSEAMPPKDAERAPQSGMSETEKQPADQAEGEATDKSMDTAQQQEREPREGLARPNMTREGFAEAAPEELTAERLEGAVVYDTNDENIGDINRLVLTRDGQIETVVLDIGGFLGIGEHQIGVTMEEIQILRNEDGEFRVYVDATKEQLESQPEYQEAE